MKVLIQRAVVTKELQDNGVETAIVNVPEGAAVQIRNFSTTSFEVVVLTSLLDDSPVEVEGSSADGGQVADATLGAADDSGSSGDTFPAPPSNEGDLGGFSADDERVEASVS